MLEKNLAAMIKQISESAYFDQAYYLQQHPQIRNSGLSAAEHYVKQGAAAGLNPSEAFNTQFYLQTYPDVAKAGINPLWHFLQHGKQEGRQALPTVSKAPDSEPLALATATAATVTALAPATEPKPAADTSNITNKNAQQTDLYQFLAKSNLFDAAFYLKTYHDVKKAGLDPLLHYIEYGAKEGRYASEFFHTEHYLSVTPAAKTSGLNPLYYYLTLDSGSGYIFERQAEHFIKEKNWLNAEACYLQLISLSPNNLNAYLQLATCYNKQTKHWQEAEALKEALKLAENNVAILTLLANATEKLRRYTEAAAYYAQLIALDSSNKDVSLWCFNQAYLLQSADSNTYNAQINSLYAQAIANDNRFNSKTAGIGVFFERSQLWQQAANAFFQHANNSWGNYALYERAANCALKAYDFTLSATILEKALLHSPAHAELYYLLAYSYQQLQQPSLAITAYQTALTMLPKQGFWHWQLAKLLQAQGEYQQACLHYQQAAVQNSTNSLAKIKPASSQDSAQQSWLTTARQHNQQLLATDSSNARLWYSAALLEAPDSEATLAMLAQAYQRSNDKDLDIIYAYANALVAKQLYQQACDIYQQAISLYPPFAAEATPEQNKAPEAFFATYRYYFEQLSVQANTMLFESFNGNSLSCNPYAIFNYMRKQSAFANWQFIWVVNSRSAVKAEYLADKRIIFIAKDSDAYLRWLSQAQYLINNSTFPDYFVRKPEQVYLNTWHGTPWKTLGNDMAERFYEHKNFTRNILQANYLLSPNAHTTEVFVEKHDIKGIFSGEILEAGYPRIDTLLNSSSQEQQQIRAQLGVSEQNNIIFYAPTWRGSHQNIFFDTDKLQQDLAALAAIPGYTVVFRGHSLLQDSLNIALPNVIVAPALLDTNELLAVTDILITDYSSVLFDYLVSNKPLYLYLYDYAEYQAERGLYFEAAELPGEIAYTIEQLTAQIQQVANYNYAEHKRKSQPFIAYDDGAVTARVVAHLLQHAVAPEQQLKVIKVTDQRQSLLIYPGPFMGNGITTSLLNLVQHIDATKYSVTLCIDPNSITKDPERLAQFSKLPKHVNIIARGGRMNFSLEDRYLHGYFNKHFVLPNPIAEHDFAKSWQHEYQRVLGFAKIDRLIDFDGYNKFWAALFAYGPLFGKRPFFAIYQHNEKYSEYTLKYPYLQAIFQYSAMADKVVAVSEMTMQLNKANLAKRFAIAEEKFDFCDNLQNPAYVLEKAAEPISNEDAALFTPNVFTFITIGRLSLEKDHEKLIRAFSQLTLAQQQQAQLLIIGDGPLLPQLTQLVQQLKLDKQVKLLGRRANPFPLLNQANCFVLSSNHEGQPMVLFEAMILNKPIVSTDIIGSRSALEGKPALLVENSIAGLSAGLESAMAGKVPLPQLDIAGYQEAALNMFYRKVCLKFP